MGHAQPADHRDRRTQIAEGKAKLAAAQAKCDAQERQIDESNARARKRQGRRRGAPNMLSFYVAKRAELREELARVVGGKVADAVIAHFAANP